ncbi:MAG TPA: primosomal protein N' [bacterium]|nr:primosomal protein N' [bacterium]
MLIEVVLPLAMRHTLTYRVPSHLAGEARPGCLVRVPLGRKHAVGCILRETPHAEKSLKIKEIDAVLRPLLSQKELKLLEWAAAYYLTPIGEVLRHLAPPDLFETRAKARETKARKKVPHAASFDTPTLPSLNAEQEAALRTVLEGLARPVRPFLLHGITGSGKTEVYLRAAQSVLETGGQVLVLVPEIGLTPQVVGRFRALGKNPGDVAVSHSGLTRSQRYEVWKGAREGRHRIVVATRSGVFLPMPRLRLIVVDEEHDSSYKQEERFCYHARDLALWRAAHENLLAILGSATPSLEALQRCAQGKMTCLRLAARPLGAKLPEVRIVDLRREKDRHPVFSSELLQELEAALKRKEQALLFVNRRGYAPFVMCPECGRVPECGRCDISLTFHKNPARLECHYCESSRPYDPVCPACGKATLSLRGFGTEKVASEVQRLFPGARVARMDRDTAGAAGGLDILEKMKRREIDVLVGTQMITKGHDYPHLTLAGILDADVGLHLPDFRAAERTYQILTQVAGRAGRAERPGTVLIQTYQPQHESLIAAVSYDGLEFCRTELGHRREAGYPPFLRLVEIRLSGSNAGTVRKTSEALALRAGRALKTDESLLGPAPRPVETVRGKSRWRVLVKTAQYARLQPKLAAILDDFAENDLPSTVKMLVNVDPVDMM